MKAATLTNLERKLISINRSEFYTKGNKTFSTTRFRSFCNLNGLQEVFQYFSFSRQSSAGKHFAALLENRVCTLCHSNISSLPAQVCKVCLQTKEGRRFAYEKGLVKMRASKNDPLKQKQKAERVLARTGYTHHMKDPDFLRAFESRRKETTGFTNPSQDPRVQAKRRATFLRKLGVDNPLKLASVRKKATNTLQDRYGVTNAMQVDQSKEKCKESWRSRFVEGHPLRNAEVKARLEETCLRKYGARNPLCDPSVRKRGQLTLIQKYGTANISSVPILREKARDTNIRKYGYDHWSKNPELFSSARRFKSKQLRLHNGQTVAVQGYEPQAYYLLTSIYGKSRVHPHALRPISLPYEFKSKTRAFHPDFAVGSHFFEVKSVYTLLNNLSMNRAKAKAQPSVRFLVIDSIKAGTFEYLLLPEGWDLLTREELKHLIKFRKTFQFLHSLNQSK